MALSKVSLNASWLIEAHCNQLQFCSFQFTANAINLALKATHKLHAQLGGTSW